MITETDEFGLRFRLAIVLIEGNRFTVCYLYFQYEKVNGEPVILSRCKFVEIRRGNFFISNSL